MLKEAVMDEKIQKLKEFMSFMALFIETTVNPVASFTDLKI